MKDLIEYYNKFNEDKRLKRPYGQVEFLTTMKYIREYIGERKDLRILDIGAATGVYSVPLSMEGHSVTAVDLVNYHVGILKQKKERMGLDHLQVFRGDARNLKKIPDASFDIVLCLGPMYHVFSEEDKVTVLCEARKKLLPGGILFTAYYMNEYGILIHGFREKAILNSLKEEKVDEDFHIRNKEEDLFSFDRIEDIDRYNERAGLKRIKILTPDGPANYMREDIQKMDDETFSVFMRYHFSTCERPDLLGAAAHLLDIVTN